MPVPGAGIPFAIPGSIGAVTANVSQAAGTPSWALQGAMYRLAFVSHNTTSIASGVNVFFLDANQIDTGNSAIYNSMNGWVVTTAASGGTAVAPRVVAGIIVSSATLLSSRGPVMLQIGGPVTVSVAEALTNASNGTTLVASDSGLWRTSSAAPNVPGGWGVLAQGFSTTLTVVRMHLFPARI